VSKPRKPRLPEWVRMNTEPGFWELCVDVAGCLFGPSSSDTPPTARHSIAQMRLLALTLTRIADYLEARREWERREGK